MESFGTWTDIKKAIEIIKEKSGETFPDLDVLRRELNGQTVLSINNVTEDDMPSVHLGLQFRRFKTMLNVELELAEHKLLINENLPTSRYTLSEFNHS